MLTLPFFVRVLAGIGIMTIVISQIGCSALFPAPATEAPTETPIPPTETPSPTDTPVPTKTPAPTSSPAPTDTPEPQDTPVPTRTPRPTATEEHDSGGDDADRRGAGSQPSGSTPDASRGQGVGEGQERGDDSDQGAEAVELDVCTLLTVDEVTDALDAGGEFESYSAEGSCSYMDTSGETALWVNVGAAQGDEAKWMLAVLVATFSMINSGDPPEDMEDLIQELQEEMEDMTVAEIVEDMLMPLYEDFGFSVDEVDGVGDTAFWLWYGEGEGQMGIGELFIVRDDAYLVIDVMGLESESDSEDAVTKLAEIALDRLPPAFDVLPDDYEDMLTPNP